MMVFFASIKNNVFINYSNIYSIATLFQGLYYGGILDDVGNVHIDCQTYLQCDLKYLM